MSQTVISFKYEANADNFLRTTQKVEQSVASLGSSAKVGAVFGAAFAVAERAVGAVSDVLVGGARAIADYSSRLQSSKVAWTQFLGSGENAEALMLRMQQIAAKSPFSFDDVERGTQRLVAMGFTLKETESVMMDAITVSSGFGKGVAGVDSLTIALGQMNSSGHVYAQDMNQLIAVGVPAWQILADATGLSVEEARKQAEQGKITSDVMLTAFHAWAGSKFGDVVAQQSRTATGALSTIKDNLLATGARAFAPVMEGFTALANRIADFTSSPAFGVWASKVAAVLAVVIENVAALAGFFASGLGAVLTVVTGVGQAIYDALSWINPFATHSPSLVSQVEDGVAVIMQAYAKLPGIGGPLGAAAGAVRAFAAAASEGMAGYEATQDQATAKTLAIFGADVPAAYLAAKAAIGQLQQSLVPLQAAITAQEGVVASWERAVKASQSTLDTEKSKLAALEQQLGTLQAAYDNAKKRVEDFAKTPLAGTKALEDQIFAVEQQATGVQLALARWKVSPVTLASIKSAQDAVAAQQGVVDEWSARVAASEQAVKGQEAAVAAAEQAQLAYTAAVKAAQGAIDAQKERIAAANATLGAQKDALAAAQRQLAEYGKAQLSGTQAFQDQLFALDMEVAAVQKRLIDLKLDPGLNAQIAATEGAIVAQTAAIADAERRMKAFDQAVEAAKSDLAQQQSILADNRAAVDAVASSLKKAQDAIKTFAGTAITGTKAFDDELFALDQQALAVQKRLIDLKLDPGLNAQIAAAQSAIDAQTTSIALAEGALKDYDAAVIAAKSGLADQQAALADNRAVVDELSRSLKKAQDAIKGFAGTDISGTKAFQDQLFALDQQAAAVKLEMNNLTLAGAAQKNPALVALQNQLTTSTNAAAAVKLQIDTLLLSGAGQKSPALIALQDQLATTNNAAAGIKLQIDTMIAGGTPKNDPALLALQRQFSAIGLQAQDVRLQIGTLMIDGAGKKDPALVALQAQLDAINLQAGDTKLQIGTMTASGAGKKDPALVALQAQLDAINLQAENVNLTKQLQLDPLRKQVSDLASTTKELSFDAIVQGIKAAQGQEGDLTKKLADANGAYAAQQTTVDAAQQALVAATAARDREKAAIDASKDALAGLNAQLNALKATQAPKELTDQLAALQDRATQVKLTERLQLDPLRMQINDLANATKELTFAEITNGIKDAQGQESDLTKKLVAANGAFAAQQAVVDAAQQALVAATAARDKEKASIDASKDALVALNVQLAALKATQAPKELTDQLANLQDRATQLKLAERLELEPLRRQIAALLNPVKEMSFSEITGGIASTRSAIATLEQQVATSTTAWENEKAALIPLEASLKDAERARDDHAKVIDREKATLAGLKGALDENRAGYTAAKDELERYNAALKAAQTAPKELTDALQALQDRADMLKLTERLQFDPLRRQIEDLAHPVKELTFEEITGGIRAAQSEMATLDPQIAAVTAQIAAQKRVVEGATVAHDAATARLAAERDTLDTLKKRYSDISGQVRDWEQALGGVASAAQGATAAAKAAADAASGPPGTKKPTNDIDLSEQKKQLQDMRDQYNKTKKEIEDRVNLWKDRLTAAYGRVVAVIVPVKDAVGALLKAFQTGDFNSAFGPLLAALDAAFGPGTSGKVALFVSQLLGGFQLVRDGFITVQQALSGKWVGDDTVQPAVRAVGDFALRLRDFALTAKDVFFNQVLPAVQQVAGFIRDHMDTIAKVVAIGAAAFAAFSIIATVVGWVTSAIAIWGVLSVAIEGVGGFVAALVIVLGGPLTLAIAAIVGVVTLLGLAWANNWGDIQGKVAAVWAWLQPVLADLGARLSQFWTDILPQLSAAWESVSTKVVAAAQWLWGVLQTVFGAVAGFLVAHGDTILAVLGGAWSLIQNTINTYLGVIGNLVRGVLALISGDWDGAWTYIRQAAQIAWNGLVAFFGAAGGLLVQALGAIWGLIRTGASAAWDAISAYVGGKFSDLGAGLRARLDAIARWWSDGWTAVGATVAGVWDGITGYVGGKFSDLGAAIRGKLDDIQGWWRDRWSAVSSFVSGIWDGIVRGVTGALGDLWSGVTGKIADLRSWLNDRWADIKATALNAWNSMVGQIVQAVINLGVTILIELAKTEALLLAIFVRIAQKGLDMATDLYNWVTGKVGDLASWVGGKIADLRDTLGGLWDSAYTKAAGVWATLWKTVTQAASDVRDDLTARITTARDWLAGLWNSIYTKATQAWSGVRDFAAQIAADMQAKITGPIDAAKAWLDGTWNSIYTKATSAWDGVRSWLLQTAGEMQSRIIGPIDAAKALLDTTWASIYTKATDAWNGVRSWLAQTAQDMQDRITAPIAAGKALLDTTWAAIYQKAIDAWNGVRQWLWDTGSDLRDRVTTPISEGRDRLVGIWQNIYDTATGKFEALKKFIWDNTGNMKDALLWPFQQAAGVIDGIVKGFGNSIINQLNGAGDRVRGFGNGVRSIINWIAEKLGAAQISGDSPAFSLPGLATGTRNWGGGMAWVGEGPGGAGAELAYLPRGAQVMTHAESMALVRQGVVAAPQSGPALVPGFAGGLDALGGIFDVLKKGAGWLYDQAKGAVGLGDLSLPGALGDIGAKMAGKVKDWALGSIDKMLKTATPVPSVSGDQIQRGIGFAEAQMGKPYIWGGGHGGSQPINADGWDCSGFVSAVLNAMGIPHPRYGIVTSFFDWMEQGPKTGYVDIGVNNPRADPDVQHMGMALGGVQYESRGSDGGVKNGTTFQYWGHPPGLTGPPPKPTSTFGQGPSAGGTGGNWGDPSIAALDDYIGGGRALSGWGDLIKGDSADRGIPANLAMTIFGHESSYGSSADGLTKYNNFSGLTTRQGGWPGQTGVTTGMARDFAIFRSKQTGIDAALDNLGYYKGLSLRQTVAKWLTGDPNATADEKYTVADYLAFAEQTINTLGGSYDPDALRFADGGVITEPIVGRGQRSGRSYTFGERGPEGIFNADQLAALSPRGGGGGEVHYHYTIQSTEPTVTIDGLKREQRREERLRGYGR